jgi:hypothetical protein
MGGPWEQAAQQATTAHLSSATTVHFQSSVALAQAQPSHARTAQQALHGRHGPPPIATAHLGAPWRAPKSRDGVTRLPPLLSAGPRTDELPPRPQSSK